MCQALYFRTCIYITRLIGNAVIHICLIIIQATVRITLLTSSGKSLETPDFFQMFRSV